MADRCGVGRVNPGLPRNDVGFRITITVAAAAASSVAAGATEKRRPNGRAWMRSAASTAATLAAVSTTVGVVVTTNGDATATHLTGQARVATTAASSAVIRVGPVYVVLVHSGVPVGFDGAVGATVDKLGDIRPPVPQAELSVVDDFLFLFCPRVFLQRRFEGFPPAAQNSSGVAGCRVGGVVVSDLR